MKKWELVTKLSELDKYQTLIADVDTNLLELKYNNPTEYSRHPVIKREELKQNNAKLMSAEYIKRVKENQGTLRRDKDLAI